MSRTLASIFLTAALAAPAFAQQGAWVHVSVRDARHDRMKVRINLPAPVVVRAAPLIPESDEAGYRLVVGDDSISARDLASILAALRAATDGTTVRRDSGDAIIEAARAGDHVQLVVREEYGGTVVATLPFPVADALAAGGRRLDVAEAVRSLAAAGGGEFALITADRSRIRIWVDGTPHQQGE